LKIEAFKLNPILVEILSRSEGLRKIGTESKTAVYLMLAI